MRRSRLPRWTAVLALVIALLPGTAPAQEDGTLTTIDGTAKAKEDYTATSGTLTFPPGV